MNAGDTDDYGDEVGLMASNATAATASKVAINSRSWRYWPAGEDGRGCDVRFCWAPRANAAGWFVGWREVVDPVSGHTMRYDRIARRKRKDVADWAKSKADAFSTDRFVRAGTPHIISIRTRRVTATEIKKWMRANGYTSAWGRLHERYAFEEAGVAVAFKLAFG